MRSAPSYIYIAVSGLDQITARLCANEATEQARRRAPRLSGKLQSSLRPWFEAGKFGVSWGPSYTFFQEEGIRPFTMNSLQGKVIPMWIDDVNGEVLRENPGAQTRVMRGGRAQTLIFRRAAMKGDRKDVFIKGKTKNVPRSYPGAPGRIKRRHEEPFVPPGKVAGRIATGNVGVRWRHPGMERKWFIHNAIMEIAHAHQLAGKLFIGEN